MCIRSASCRAKKDKAFREQLGSVFCGNRIFTVTRGAKKFFIQLSCRTDYREYSKYSIQSDFNAWNDF